MKVVALAILGLLSNLTFAALRPPCNNIKLRSDSITHGIERTLLRQFVSICEHNIILNNVEANSEYLYWASNSITMGEDYKLIVNSGSDIRMKAGKVIVLKPKTTISRGNHYLARIEPCQPPCPSAATAVVPKGISPNDDNLNDTFDLAHLCVQEIKIFNRYGLQVYEAQNYSDQWHGQSDKGELPDATYFYLVVLSTGEKLSGWVYLQR